MFWLCELAPQAWKKLSLNVISTSNCGNPSLRLFGFGPVCPQGFGIGYIIKVCVKTQTPVWVGEHSRLSTTPRLALSTLMTSLYLFDNSLALYTRTTASSLPLAVTTDKQSGLWTPWSEC